VVHLTAPYDLVGASVLFAVLLLLRRRQVRVGTLALAPGPGAVRRPRGRGRAWTGSRQRERAARLDVLPARAASAMAGNVALLE
jgi:hypothetical protein